MAQTKTQAIIRYGFYGVLVLGLVGLLLYFLVIRSVQINNQRQNFAKAEASLDALEKQIEDKIGKPDQIKKEKSCDRANLKSEKGPLGCDVSVYMLYENKNASDATVLLQKVTTFSSQQIRIGSGAAKGKSFVDRLSQSGEQTFYQNFNSNSSLSCAFSYTYPATDHEVFRTAQIENLQIGLGCGGSAMAEFYPVKN